MNKVSDMGQLDKFKKGMEDTLTRCLCSGFNWHFICSVCVDLCPIMNKKGNKM